jgi:hypothetical protein
MPNGAPPPCQTCDLTTHGRRKKTTSKAPLAGGRASVHAGPDLAIGRGRPPRYRFMLRLVGTTHPGGPAPALAPPRTLGPVGRFGALLGQRHYLAAQARYRLRLATLAPAQWPCCPHRRYTRRHAAQPLTLKVSPPGGRWRTAPLIWGGRLAQGLPSSALVAREGTEPPLAWRSRGAGRL